MLRPIRSVSRLFLAVPLALMLVTPAYAPTWTVCSSGCDFTSIQAAVDAATSGDTIQLAAETFYESVTFDKDLTVRGAGPDRTVVDGSAGSHVFQHTAHSLILSDMTVRNADVGIDSTGHEMTVENCVIRDNTTGVSVTTTSDSFVGIYPDVVITTTTITGTPLSDCIRNAGANMTIERSTISGCATGISTTGAYVYYAYGGGYGYGVAGSTAITNSTVTDTRVGVSVVCKDLTPFGGCSDCPPCALATCGSGSTSIRDSTIADSSQSGVRADYSCPVFSHGGCTNISCGGLTPEPHPCPGCFASLSVEGSLVDNSGISNCSGVGLAAAIEGEFNLSSDKTCPWENNIDPLLLPLAYNGGSTPTHALAPGSPAIDAGGLVCPETDQRGVGRPADGDGDGIALCDIGSFEFVPLGPVDLLDALTEQVVSLNLPHGIENSLLAKLNVALLVLTDVPTGNDHAAVNILGAFVNQVEAQHGRKIAAADADALIDAAEEILGLR